MRRVRLVLVAELNVTSAETASVPALIVSVVLFPFASVTVVAAAFAVTVTWLPEEMVTLSPAPGIPAPPPLHPAFHVLARFQAADAFDVHVPA